MSSKKDFIEKGRHSAKGSRGHIQISWIKFSEKICLQKVSCVTNINLSKKSVVIKGIRHEMIQKY